MNKFIENLDPNGLTIAFAICFVLALIPAGILGSDLIDKLEPVVKIEKVFVESCEVVSSESQREKELEAALHAARKEVEALRGIVDVLYNTSRPNPF